MAANLCRVATGIQLIPAQAGIQSKTKKPGWVPAFAGTSGGGLRTAPHPAHFPRNTLCHSAVIAGQPTLRPELGDDAMDALLGEMSLTLQIDPYRRRVFAVARSA